MWNRSDVFIRYDVICFMVRDNVFAILITKIIFAPVKYTNGIILNIRR